MKQIALPAATVLALMAAFSIGSRQKPPAAPPIAHAFGSQTLPVPAAPLHIGGRTLKSTGKATMTVEPDRADVSLTLSVEPRATAIAATATTNQMKARLLAELGKLGVHNRQVALSHLSLTPVYDYPSSQPRRLVGYRSRITARVELKDFERIGPVVDAIARSGGTDIRTSFRSTRLTDLKRQVRDMALRAAREKAQQMADALGIEKLVVASVSETPSNGWSSWGGVSNAVATARPSGSATATVTPESTSLTLTIYVEYTIV